MNISNTVKLNNTNNKNIDLTKVESLTCDDHFTNTLKQMAKSITQKNDTKSALQIKQQKLNELRTSKLKKQLELRKYLKSLYKFKLDLAFYQTFVYNFNKNNYVGPGYACGEGASLPQPYPTQQKHLKNLYYILKNSFLTFYCIISKPILEITPNKLKIKLFYYNLKQARSERGAINTTKYLIKELNYLCINLSKLLKISVVFDLVELKGIQLEGNILANSIGIITDKIGRNFGFTANKFFSKTTIINPDKINYNKNKINGNNDIAYYTGINIKLAGRLSRQSIIPRKTVKINQKGSLARQYTDFLTVSKYTAKNRKGIFCYTVTIGHKFY